MKKTLRYQISAVSALLVMILVPASGHGGAIGGAYVTLPSNVTVGQTSLSGSILLQNNNTPPDVTPSTVSNISLFPSCATTIGTTCNNPDPGVFSLPVFATGRAGTACAGNSFSITQDSVTGKFFFTPYPNQWNGSLSVGESCRIDFTFSVRKSPTVDVSPGTPGLQTNAFVNATYTSSSGSSTLSGSAQTTVTRATPTLSTTASTDIVKGGSITDQATITGLVSPVAGATVQFELYPPSTTNCTGGQVFVSSNRPVTLSGTTGTATSAAFTPTVGGVYRWVATYQGDANNAPVIAPCNAPNENVDVFGRRGDANGDHDVTISDVFYIVNFLFANGEAPRGSADANGVDGVTVADVFYLINFLFAGGTPPPPL